MRSRRLGCSKLRAFTLLEVLIGILISSLLIGFCYAGLMFFRSYFSKLDANGKAFQEALLVNEVFSKHWDQSRLVLSDGSNFVFMGDSLNTWRIGDSIMYLNEQTNLEFKRIVYQSYSRPWRDGKMVVDSLKMSIYLSPTDSMELNFHKYYPPALRISNHGYFD